MVEMCCWACGSHGLPGNIHSLNTNMTPLSCESPSNFFYMFCVNRDASLITFLILVSPAVRGVQVYGLLSASQRRASTLPVSPNCFQLEATQSRLRSVSSHPFTHPRSYVCLLFWPGRYQRCSRGAYTSVYMQELFRLLLSRT